MILFGNLRFTPDPSEEPRARLYNWILVSKDGVSKRLVGQIDPKSPTLRMTTELQALDTDRMVATTSSGRVYELVTPPAADPALITLLLIRAHLDGESYADVTGKYFPRELEAAGHVQQPSRGEPEPDGEA